jgi:CubicO group peptidase (beta-lactamase class C family)
MRETIACSILVLFCAVPLVAQRGNPAMELGGQSVDGMIAGFMKEHGVAGMAVAIVQAPYVTRSTGYGLSDAERRTLVSGNTIFNVGQMRNAFTGVAVMQLVEAGKLSLEDVRPLLADPSAYPRLEALVAKTSGQSYEDFVTKRQFEPLGVRHTFFERDLENVPRESLVAGERHRRFLQMSSLIDPTEPATGYRDGVAVKPAASAIYSSAADISFWDIGLAGEILVKDAALRKILYSSGSGPWTFPGHPGLMIVTGSANGFSSLLSRFTAPDELVCVTLLANKEGLDLTQLARKIAGAHNPKLGPPARAAGMRVQQSPHPLAETDERLQRAFRERGLDADALGATAWEEKGEVWVVANDPKTVEARDAVDAALLAAVSAPNPTRTSAALSRGRRSAGR